jgi:hypothetical protein
MNLRALLSVVAALPLLAAACGSDDPEENHEHQQPAECEPISDACHAVDTGDPGPIHDCHETGHDGTAAECTAAAANCIALCEAAAADGGGHDGGHDAGHD